MSEPIHAGQSMRDALRPVVDAVILARDTAAIRGTAVNGPELMDIITRVYPDPAVASMTTDQLLTYALDQLGFLHLTQVVLASRLLDELCAATGEDGADVLRRILESFPEVGGGQG